MDDHGVTIRPLTIDEVPQWWELRLRALRDHPEAFGPDYETARDEGYGYLLRNFRGDAGVNATFVAVDPDAASSPRRAPSATAASGRISPSSGAFTPCRKRETGASRAG